MARWLGLLIACCAVAGCGGGSTSPPLRPTPTATATANATPGPQSLSDVLEDPTGLALGHDGTMWIANRGGGSLIGVHASELTDGADPRVRQEVDNLAAPTRLAFDKAGNLWTVFQDSGDVGVWQAKALKNAKPGAPRTLPLKLGRPSGLAFAPDGSLWISAQDDAALTKLTPGDQEAANPKGHKVTLPAGPAPGNQDLCFDPKGRLWLVQYDIETVVVYQPQGNLLTKFAALALPGDGPSGIACAPNGTAIVAGTDDSVLEQLTLDGAKLTTTPISADALQRPFEPLIAGKQLFVSDETGSLAIGSAAPPAIDGSAGIP